MVEIKINDMDSGLYLGDFYSLPENWNELEAWHLKAVALGIESKDAAGKWFSVVVRKFLGGKRFGPFNNKKAFQQSQLTDESVAEIVAEFKWLGDDIILNKSLFRRVGLLYGPKANFSRMTCNEFAFAETLLVAYEQCKDAEKKKVLLYKLIGVIYRPLGLPFWNRLHEAWTWLAKHFIKEDTKIAILYAFKGLRNKFLQTHSAAFSKSSSNKAEAWPTILIGLADDKIVDLPRVKRRHISDIMLLLTKKKKEYQKQKADAERLKRKR